MIDQLKQISLYGKKMSHRHTCPKLAIQSLPYRSQFGMSHNHVPPGTALRHSPDRLREFSSHFPHILRYLLLGPPGWTCSNRRLELWMWTFVTIKKDLILQESPAAWTQEAYRPRRIKYSIRCPIPEGGSYLGQGVGTLGYPPSWPG